MSKIYVVSLGPGSKEYLSFKALDALKDSDIIVGYKTYVNLVKKYIDDKEFINSGMRSEVDRCNKVINLAKEGKNVSLISSGDVGVYGMAGILLELVDDDIEVEVIPGISSANACASLLGAPLMHDYSVISLSDLLTDYDLIMNRIECAGKGDFVIALYNPKSKKRVKHIEEARKILLKYKDGSTPVGIVKNAMRDDQNITITTLEDMLNHNIDMLTTVLIGNRNTYVKNGKMITPRGYDI